MPWRENKGVANLNGIYTDGLGLPVGKKSLEEIFLKNGRGPEKDNNAAWFWELLRKMFWSSEDRVKARFHYAESRQNKP